ncbi:hypothetical protein BN136_36 [Cronobacter universalis NCTC 9529]|nr:hypothetical protein BN136_36 [Cronobacter universalis NCTC 9529]
MPGDIHASPVNNATRLLPDKYLITTSQTGINEAQSCKHPLNEIVIILIINR